MQNKHLEIQELFSIIVPFRKAIVNALLNREFSRKDRMSNFPYGCCDDSCDLLGYYLYDQFQINTKQINGVYRDSIPEEITNHVWLLLDDIIIDITADQFSSLIENNNGVYVGVENEFYQQLEDKQTLLNYDIRENQRLWNDYQIILQYLD
ncbi:hypothetical protein [uncultured Thomasclavelia sp.]|uniref:hypothetical protein n=1 Tax=uncultured Thomasclavelia sp. TaxID=3025759 RepID=UPI002634BD43|nr:hypothetical protein [uncultured Thomasclavelia sp.]